jgi:hypothetical protein
MDYTPINNPFAHLKSEEDCFRDLANNLDIEDELILQLMSQMWWKELSQQSVDASQEPVLQPQSHGAEAPSDNSDGPFSEASSEKPQAG